MNMYFFTRGCLAAALFLLFRTGLSAAENQLAVVNAGIQQEDNGAFAPRDYRFGPGDPLFVVFEISGFHINRDEEKDTRSISLRWEVSVLDEEGVPLAPAQEGEIKTGLSSEDKQWLPKRRAEFVLPELVGAGDYHVHIDAKDLLGHAEAEKEIQFHIGGRKIEPSHGVGIQQTAFSRSEGGPALEVAAYQPGDTIFLSFDVTGFAQTETHEYHVAYRFDVLAPDGKVFVNPPQPVELSAKSFYPAKFVPVNFSVLTPPGSARGKYTVVLSVTDEVANQSSVGKCAFTLE